MYILVLTKWTTNYINVVQISNFHLIFQIFTLKQTRSVSHWQLLWSSSRLIPDTQWHLSPLHSSLTGSSHTTLHPPVNHTSWCTHDMTWLWLENYSQYESQSQSGTYVSTISTSFNFPDKNQAKTQWRVWAQYKGHKDSTPLKSPAYTPLFGLRYEV